MCVRDLKARNCWGMLHFKVMHYNNVYKMGLITCKIYFVYTVYTVLCTLYIPNCYIFDHSNFNKYTDKNLFQRYG